MDKIPPELNEILEKLSSEQRRLFVCDCAEHVLPYFEQFQPQDNRPRVAIEVARQYAWGKASREELDKAGSDAEMAAWEAGDAAWRNLPDGTGPQFRDDAATSAAATAEGCTSVNMDSTVESVVNTAIGVVIVAAVGGRDADAVWSGIENTLDVTVLQRYREAEAQERAWQMRQAQSYLTTHSETQ